MADKFDALKRPTRQKPKHNVLFETEPDWRSEWWGMPDFAMGDARPQHKITVNFMTAEDVKAFADVTGLPISTQSDSIWFPHQKRLIGEIYYDGPPTDSKYPICIPSKGRADCQKTGKALDRMGVSYKFFVEETEYDEYCERIGELKVVKLPFHDLGQGSIPVRNFIWGWAKEREYKRHWTVDDNLEHFMRMHNNRRLLVKGGGFFQAIEDFVDRYENIAIAGPHDKGFAPDRSPDTTPFLLNSRIYSCILLDTTLPHRWRGRYNEDTDLSLRLLKDGYCSLLFRALLMGKMDTVGPRNSSAMKGGNTDNVYNTDDHRLAFAKSLEEQHPDCVKVVWKFNRWHHQVDYSMFKNNRLKLREGITPTKSNNEYGMRLVRKKEEELVVRLPKVSEATPLFGDQLEQILTPRKRAARATTKRQSRSIVKPKVRPEDMPIADFRIMPDSDRNIARGIGDNNPDIVFVGFTISQREVDLGGAFTTQAGRKFRNMVEKAEVSDAVYYTSILRSATRAGQKPTKKEIANDLHFLMDDLNEMKPKLVVLCGPDAFKAVLPYANYRKDRGTVLQRGGFIFSSTFHYSKLSQAPQDIEICNRDLVRFRNILNNLYEQPATDYTLIKTLDGVRAVSSILLEMPFAFDVETDGLDMFAKDARLNTMAFSVDANSAFCVPIDHPQSSFVGEGRGRLFDLLRPVFTNNVPKYGQNIKFDAKWISSILGVRVKNITFDTMLAHYILDERRGGHGLERLAIDYLDAAPYKIDTKGGTSKYPLPKLSNYNCQDADYTFQLVGKLSACLKAEKLYPVFENLIMPGLQTLIDIEIDGVNVDRAAITKARIYLESRVDKAENHLLHLVETAGWEGDFDLHSTAQLKRLFFDVLEMPVVIKTDKGAPSLNEEALNTFDRDYDCEIATTLLEYRRMTKLLSTYVVGFGEAIKADGRLHPTVNIHITPTGRLSYEDPNLQNLPKRNPEAAAMIRGFVVPSFDGGYILQADYRQAEIGMLALCANDKALIEAYNSGQDVHLLNAAWMFGVPDDLITKKQRAIAKGVTFGLIYGQSAHALAIAVGCSEAKARGHIAAFFDRYPDVKKWIDDIHVFVRKYGYVPTIYGRQRRIYGAKSRSKQVMEAALRQAQNTPIQSPASDMTWDAMTDCACIIEDDKLQSKPLIMIHDANVFDCPKDEVKSIAEIVKYVMEHVVVPGNTGVRFSVDVEIGRSFGALVPYTDWVNGEVMV